MYNGSFLYPRFKPDDGDDGTPFLYIIWWIKGTTISGTLKGQFTHLTLGLNR